MMENIHWMDLVGFIYRIILEKSVLQYFSSSLEIISLLVHQCLCKKQRCKRSLSSEVGCCTDIYSADLA